MLNLFAKSEYGRQMGLLTLEERRTMQTTAEGRLRFGRIGLCPLIPYVSLNHERTEDSTPVPLHLLPDWMYSARARAMLFVSTDWLKYLHMLVEERIDLHGNDDEPWKWTRSIVLLPADDDDLWTYITLYTDVLYETSIRLM